MERNYMEDLDIILKFNSEFLIRCLNGEEAENDLAKVRESCDAINKAGIYPFETQCSDSELIDQIQEFSMDF